MININVYAINKKSYQLFFYFLVKDNVLQLIRIMKFNAAI